MDAALPALEINGRLGRLRALFDLAEIDGLLVTDLTNVRYLTGFTGSAAILAVTSDAAVFVSDGRYRDQAAEELGRWEVDAQIEIHNTEQSRIVKGALASTSRIGLESSSVTWKQVRTYRDEWFGDADMVATIDLVEELRLIKDDGEVARIEAAASIADAALAEVRTRLAERPTEREFGLELDFQMLRMGAEALSFETIVAGGPNGAKPHAKPGDRIIGEGDLVITDFGAVVDGYHSDMTRTHAVGQLASVPARMLEIVLESQAAGVAEVRPGRPTQEVDAVCRQVIADAGWANAFIHGTGHGVGLLIHEAPRLATTSIDELAIGQIVTVEPGVYLPEWGGVRIEDTLVVTADGSRTLTKAPKLPAVY